MSEYNIEKYEEDYKSTSGDVQISLYCNCPYCTRFQDVWNNLDIDDLEYFRNGYSVDDCEMFVDCERCKKTFRITSTSY